MTASSDQHGPAQRARVVRRGPLADQVAGVRRHPDDRREQHDLGDDQLPVRRGEQRVDRGHLDQRLHDAGEEQRRHGERRPARPDRQDRAQLPSVGLPEQEGDQHDQPAQPDRHAGQVGRVDDHGDRRHRGGGRVPGQRPGGQPDDAEDGQQRPVGDAAAAGQQRAEQEGAPPPARRAGPGARCRTCCRARHAARRRRSSRRRSCTGACRNSSPTVDNAISPRPAQASRLGPRAGEPVRPEQREHQRRADQQHQAGVPEVFDDRDRDLEERCSPRPRARRRRSARAEGAPTE